MKFDRYAGLLSAVGIVLILMIAAWLDLWGPIKLEKLKEWQTLMASFMAIVAAGIAYCGATVNMRFNKATIERAQKDAWHLSSSRAYL